MKIEYDKYIQSDEWRAKRKIALQRAGYRCQLCNSPHKLEVHHRTYERLGNELPKDLTVLCEKCHNQYTKYARRRDGKKQNSQQEILNKTIAKVKRELKTARFSQVPSLKKYLEELKGELRKCKQTYYQ